MRFVTGDIHGDVYEVVNAIRKYGIQKADSILLLGDVGVNYYGDANDGLRKHILNNTNVPVLCVHGNHEMRPETIRSYYEEEWHGGIVYIQDEFPNIRFAKDGEVYDFDGKKVLVIGGAYSVDKHYRLSRGLRWFPDEQASEEVKRRVEAKLASLNWKVDAIASHTCPAKYIPVEMFLPGVDQSEVDRSMEDWLDTIEERTEYSAWYCGHWHTNKRIDKMHFLYDGYETLD